MKITEIEVHEIKHRYVDWIDYPLMHYEGPKTRTIYVVHTDDGLEGLGESGRTEPQETIDQYIGTSPFDWIGDETSLGLGTAMYDLMGKAVGVPAYKLIGQKRRSWVARGSWTVSSHPEHMAEAVEQYAAQGFTWLKFHLSPFENVFDQIEAMEAVAPVGFRLHYDFTGGGTTDHMPELLMKMAEHPISGCFEDTINAGDTLASIELRNRIRLPIVRHQAPLNWTSEVLMRAGDIYMLGHQRIGDAIRKAGLFAASNNPFMLQNVGGNITMAMTIHMMSVFPTATFHFFTDAETWEGDVVDETFEVVNGHVRVPEKPGLGVTLNRERLEFHKDLSVPRQEGWILKSRFANGTNMFNVYEPGKSGHFLIRPDWRGGGLPMSYASPITTEYWDNDGSPEFKQMYERIEREGMVLERG